MKKAFLFLFATFLFVSVLLPKRELFFAVEGYLKNKNVYINENRIKEELFKITLMKADIYFDTNKIARIKEAKIYLLPWGIYGYFKNIETKNQKFKKIDLNYQIFKPLKIDIKIESKKADIDGFYNLKTKKLYLKAKNIKKEFLNTDFGLFFKKRGNFYEFETKF